MSIKVTATDLAGATASDVFDLSVTGSDQPPIVALPIADQTTNEDAPFAFTIAADAFTDPDAGDTLTVSATRSDGSALPAWLTFDATTRTLSGMPVNGDVGSVAIKVAATDGGGLSTFDTFSLTVVNVNDAPTLATAIADQAAIEDAAFSFVVPANAFADVDVGDTLTYSATKADGSALRAWVSCR